MTHILIFVAAALIASFFSALLRKNAPETAILLGAALFVAVLSSLAGDAGMILGEIESMMQRTGIKREIFFPLLKVLGISLVSGAAGAVCTDAGEKAAAFLLNLAGTVCAFAAALPLMEKVVEMLLTYL